VKNFSYSASIALLCAVVAMMCFSAIADDDVFWHLANGRWIWEHRSIPEADVLSYPTAGVTVMPTEWGWELFTFLLVKITGTLASLQVLTAVIWLAIVGLLTRIMKKSGISPSVMVLVLLVTSVISLDRMSPRPHLITLLGMSLVLSRYFHARYLGKGGMRSMLVLPAVFVVWTNMHPGVLAGALLLTLLYAAEWLRLIVPPTAGSGSSPLDRDELKFFGLAWLACVAALFVNPHGWRTWVFLFQHANFGLLSTVIEWQSPFSSTVSSGNVWLFRIAFFAYAITILYALRSKDPLHALLYAAFALYALRAVRFQSEFAIVNAVGVALSIEYVIRKTPEAVSKTLTGTAGTLAAMIPCVVMLFSIPGNQLYGALRYHNRFGTGIDNDYFSSGLMKFMKDNGVAGRPFNSFSIGGWISWELPGEKTFIDSRDFDERIAAVYDSTMGMLPGFEEKLASFGVDYVVLQLPDLRQNPRSMMATLIPYCSSHKEEWKLVYWDDWSFLYLRYTERFKPLCDRYEYAVADPYLYSALHERFDSLRVSDAGRFSREISRKIAEEPDGVILRYFVRYAAQNSPR